MKTGSLALACAPFMIASAVGGWVGYGPFVRGAVPIVAASAGDDEKLLRLLHDRGYGCAMADYWTAYRLTLLSRESVVFVPKNASEDRYAPYRERWKSAREFAYVFDRHRSREQAHEIPAALEREGVIADRAQIGELSVFFVKRR